MLVKERTQSISNLDKSHQQEQEQEQELAELTEDTNLDEEEEYTSQASNCPKKELAEKRAWTRDEIEDLHYMSFHDHSLKEMMYEFQRPRKKILRALRKIQLQQALFYPLHEVATAHNIDEQKLVEHLKDPLYYVPLPENNVPQLLIAATVIFGIVASYGYLFF